MDSFFQTEVDTNFCMCWENKHFQATHFIANPLHYGGLKVKLAISEAYLKIPNSVFVELTFTQMLTLQTPKQWGYWGLQIKPPSQLPN